MHCLKHLSAIGAMLAFGSALASATPLLDTWVFSIDNDIFITGGTLSDLSQPQAFTIDYGGVTTATLSANLDASGLGTYSVVLDGDASSSHVVTFWVRDYMTSTNSDGTTGSSTYSTGNYAGVGNLGLLPANVQYQASDYTDLTNNGFPTGYIGAGPSDPNYNPLTDSIAGQDIGSANVQGNDTSTWCCDPALGIAVTQSLDGSGEGTYTFGTEWVPETWLPPYNSDPGIQQDPIDAFYLSEQSYIDSSSGQLDYYASLPAADAVPEPGTAVMISVGALLVLLGKRRKGVSPD